MIDVNQNHDSVCMSKMWRIVNATPPDSNHKKSTKYPDRDTIPTSIECKMCGNLNTIYWKSIQ